MSNSASPITIENLGPCNNPECEHGGNCYYTPAEPVTEEEKGSREILKKKCVCKCLGAYHVIRRPPPKNDPPIRTDPPPPPPPPKTDPPPPKDSDQQDGPSHGGSHREDFRPFQAPRSASDWKSSGQPSFQNATRARKEREKADLHEDHPSSSKPSFSAGGTGSANKFNPSTKLHQQADASASNRHNNKKPKKGTQPNVKKTPKPPPQKKTKSDEPEVTGSKERSTTGPVHAQSGCPLKCPSSNRIGTLYDNDLLKEIHLQSSASPEEINEAVKKAFNNVPAVRNNFRAVMDDWVLLRRERTARKGARAPLRIHRLKEGQLHWSMLDLQVVRFSTSEPLCFTNTVLIGLSSTCDDLTLEIASDGDSSAESVSAHASGEDEDYGSDRCDEKEETHNTNHHSEPESSSEATPSENSKKVPIFNLSDDSDDELQFTDYDLNNSASTAFNGEAEPEAQATSDHTESQAVNEPEPVDVPPQAASDIIPESCIPELYRLTRNIANPKTTRVPFSIEKGNAEVFWSTSVLDDSPWDDLNDLVFQQQLELDAKDYKTPEQWAGWDVLATFEKLYDELLPVFAFLLDATPIVPEQHPSFPMPCPPDDSPERSKAFAKYVRFGPLGMEPLLQHLFDIYSALLNAYRHPENTLNTDHVHHAVRLLNYFADPAV